MKNHFKLTLIGLMLSTQAAFACDCAERDVPQMLKRSDSAFLGIASGNSVRIGYDSDIGGGPLMRTKFSVIKGFKNASSKVTYLRSIKHDGANCGASFKKDDGLWVIFSYKDTKGKLHTDGCSLLGIGSEDTYKLLRQVNSL